MKISDITLLQTLAQSVKVGSKRHTLLFNHIAGTTYRSSTIVTVLHNGITSTCHNKTGSSRYIKRGFAVTAGSHNIYYREISQINLQLHLCERITKPQHLINRYASHQKSSNDGRHLCLCHFPPYDGTKQFTCLTACEIFIFQ